MKKSFIALITITSAAIFCLLIFRSLFYIPADEVPLPKEALKEINASTIQAPITAFPNTLIIPSINVNADIQQVGITAKGNMATPNNFTGVGWYKYGALPGNKGSAVIAGHVDNGLALPAVFYHLDNLKTGDDIYIQREDGKTLHFTVIKKDIYDFNASVPEVFNQNNGRLLKLITCAGVFVSKYHTHDKRLVVTAALAQ